jgi:hypothetical protein
MSAINVRFAADEAMSRSAALAARLDIFLVDIRTVAVARYHGASANEAAAFF